MTYEDMLKLWATINALPEENAKLALFGLVIQILGQQGEKLDSKILEEIKHFQKEPLFSLLSGEDRQEMELPIEKVRGLLSEDFITCNSTHEHAPPGHGCGEECGVSLENQIAASNPVIAPMRSGGKKHKKCMNCWQEYIEQLANKIDAFYLKSTLQ